MVAGHPAGSSACPLASLPSLPYSCAPMPIRRVSIEEGCIACAVCQDEAPHVFQVVDGEDCVICPDAARHFEALAESIRQAAEDCPVEVIVIEEN